MLFVGVGTIWQIGLLTNCSSALDILISGRMAGFSGNLEQAARLRWRSFNRQKKNTVDCCLFLYISNNCKSPWSCVPIFHHCHQGQGQRRQKMMHLPPWLVAWLVGWLVIRMSPQEGLASHMVGEVAEPRPKWPSCSHAASRASWVRCFPASLLPCFSKCVPPCPRDSDQCWCTCLVLPGAVVWCTCLLHLGPAPDLQKGLHIAQNLLNLRLLHGLVRTMCYQEGLVGCW